MKTAFAIAFALLAAGTAAPAAAPKAQLLCGWLYNPTPGNWSLVDRRGEWVLGVQGGYQAPGLDKLPDLTESEWIVTNASSYGYGCGCARAVVNLASRHVSKLISYRKRPLSACRRDKALPKS